MITIRKTREMQEVPETLRSVGTYPLSESPMKGAWRTHDLENGLGNCAHDDDDSNYYLRSSVWLENSRGFYSTNHDSLLAFGHEVDTHQDSDVLGPHTAPVFKKFPYPPVLQPNSKIKRVCDDISERRKRLRKRFKTIRHWESGRLAMCRLLGQSGLWGI